MNGEASGGGEASPVSRGDPPLRRVFGAIASLAVLRTPSGADLRGRDAAVVLLALLALSEFVLIDRFAPGSAAQFFPDGLLTLATYLLVGLCGAWLLSRCSRPRVAFADALLLVVGLSLVAIGVFALIDYGLPPARYWAAGAALGVYGALFLKKGLGALTGSSQWRAVTAAAVLAAGFFWISAWLDWSPSLWSAPAEGSSAAYRETQERGEELLFDQAEKIDTALAAMSADRGPAPDGATRDGGGAPRALGADDGGTVPRGGTARGRAGMPSGGAARGETARDGTGGEAAQMYFVGFAGVGEEKVFADEIALAAHRVDERYGVRGRSLLLINDQRDLNDVPLATVSGLERVLRGIGERMDRDRDVVFIALSSHGSDEPDLAVSNGALPLLQLTPEDLRAALDAAGIRWRVIVVSACYAGGFVQPLSDAHTIVIAAAAADRTSFGCSNDRSLTYFGEAFYRDALPGAASLREAFESARRAIEKRETAERIDPSRPTAFFGAAMEAKLAAMEADGAAAGKRASMERLVAVERASREPRRSAMIAPPLRTTRVHD